MNCRKFLTATLAMFVLVAASQELAGERPQPDWQQLDSGVNASLRGLCVVDANVIWASGTGGTVIRSVDSGKNWRNVSVPEAKDFDFRDIHAFDAERATIMSAGYAPRVFQTSDGGRTWHVRYEHPNRDAFFDALSFWDERHGIVMGDPLDDRVLLIETTDGGKTWTELPASRRPKRNRGEAGFAASGSNMTVVGDCVYIALGGGEEGQHEETSRIVYSLDRARAWNDAVVPIPRGPSSGVFSIAFADAKNGVAVGGDYKKPAVGHGNIAITTDGGKTWQAPKGTPPRGFRSGVGSREMGKAVVWVAVGTSGSDYSLDGGHNWQPVSETSFHAVRFSPDTSVGFASGADGRLARWSVN